MSAAKEIMIVEDREEHSPNASTEAGSNGSGHAMGTPVAGTDGPPAVSALRWVDAFVSKSESPANLLQIVEHLLDLRFLFAPLDSLTGGHGRRAA
jgi:hypothetical protein